MAVTKIHAIKSTLSKALNYIENPEKTDDQFLVSGYNVDPLVASIEFEMTARMAEEIKGNYTKTGGGNNLAYHMMQSFSPDDKVTPQEAHEIGKKLANEFLEGKYEYVISTHIDKGHIHNHIIFNAVSFYDLKKINTQPFKTASKIRSISDRICTEHELSVIEEKGNLGHSYKEYLERKKNTSWKSEIRKRLNFILEKATDYEEFKTEALALGVTVVDTGKHIKYQVEGQINFTRGNKLSDTGHLEKEGILQTLESNKKAQETIKDAIRKSVQQASDYEHFRDVLKEQFSIVTNREKSGLVTYRIDDLNGIKLKERVLGFAYSTVSIKAAIHEKAYDFQEPDSISIAEEFNKTVRTKVEQSDTRILLKAENINKITVDGILLNIPDSDNLPGKIFIDNYHINFIESSGEYEIYIGSKYDYYFVKEEVDPDVTEAEQLSGKYIKGENLIRNLELNNQIESVEIEIAADDIKAISPKGVTISLPDRGIESIFIENEFVSYDRAAGGSCKVELYGNWNYSYRSTDPQKQNVLINIKGNDLISNLKNRELLRNQSLVNRIAAMERRSVLAETKELANILLLLRRESINKVEDFDALLTDLQSKASGIRTTMKALEEKNEQYKVAAKYLIAFNKYLPVKQDMAKQTAFTRKKYESKFESEIRAFDYAAEQLEKMGLNSDVDPDKVIVLIKEQSKTVSEMNKELKGITERISSIQKAQDTVNQIQKDEHRREDQLKKKGTSEIEI